MEVGSSGGAVPLLSLSMAAELGGESCLSFPSTMDCHYPSSPPHGRPWTEEKVVGFLWGHDGCSGRLYPDSGQRVLLCVYADVLPVFLPFDKVERKGEGKV